MLTMSISLAFMCLRPRPTCTEAGFLALRSRFGWVFFVLGSFASYVGLSGCNSVHMLCRWHFFVHLACPVCAADEDVCIGAFDAWEVSPAD